VLAAFLALAGSSALAGPPALVFSTYMGGTGGEFSPQSAQGGIAIDTAGNIYVAGDTAPASGLTGLDFPLSPGSVLTDLRGGTGLNRGRDIFVAKLDPTGSTLLWLTYLGGSGTDDLASLALGPDGSVYVSSRTTSADLPVTPGALQGSLAGAADAFVARLSADGTTLIYLTYLGGSGSDHPNALAVDASGHAYVAGSTDSPNYPTTAGVFGPVRNGSAADAFVTKLAPSGVSLAFSTYFGGTGVEQAFSVSVGPGGEITVAGQTRSTNLPLAAPYQATPLGASDIFLTRFDASAATLVFSTYFGGVDPSSAPEQGRATLAPGGDVVLAGFTGAPDFPRVNAVQTAFAGGLDAFVARFRWTGSALHLVHSTYLGGSSGDAAFGLAVDPFDNAIIVGATQSANFPTSNALDAVLGGDQDAFVAKLDATGALIFSTYVGGTTDPFSSVPERLGADAALAVATDVAGSVAVAGQTGSSDFPALSLGGGAPYDSTLASSEDAFVLRLAEAAAPTIAAIAPTDGPVAGGIEATLTGTGFWSGATVRFGGTLATNVIVRSSTSLTLTVPAHAPGVVDIVITNPDNQSGTLAQGFTYSADSDGDGMPDEWEAQFGVSDPTADPDEDGAPNLKEYQDGTNPVVAELRYFAEGASSGFFTTRFAFVNPDPTRTATVVLQFADSRGQRFFTAPVISLPPRSRRTVEPKADLADDGFPLVPPPGAAHVEFSTVVRSNLPVVADRTMTWDGSAYASHAERAIVTPADTWYLAEGATIAGFELFYLIQAVDPDVVIDVTYLLASGPPVVRCYGAPGCAYGTPNDRQQPLNGRVNIWTNQDPALQNQEFSAVIRVRDGKRVIVERAMYLSAGGLFWGAGHESAGITEPETRWIFAEGATGPFFDLFVLIANPNDQPASVTAEYRLPDGTVCTKTYGSGPPDRRLRAKSRFNIWVDQEVDGGLGTPAPAGCGPTRLANTAVSVTITSDIPVIAERAMWWPGHPAQWAEAHNSAGATETGTMWAVAEGEAGNALQAETYLLVANTSAYPGRARVSLFFEDDDSVVTRTVVLPPNSRTNVPVGVMPGTGVGQDPNGFGDVSPNRRFGALIESVTAPGQSAPAEIVVERAMYSAGPGASFWAAGTNALGTRLQ
jgi:hypothetical protein